MGIAVVLERTWVAGMQVEGHGGPPPGQGPFMKVTLRVEEGVIREAGYETYQCPACHDCGKALTAMVKGKGLQEAGSVKWEHLVERVGPLPRATRHCYGLALLALADALKKLEGMMDARVEG